MSRRLTFAALVGALLATVFGRSVDSQTRIDVNQIFLSASPRLVGRSTAGSGAGEEITVGSGLTLSGGVLTATGGGTITGSGTTGKIPKWSSSSALTDSIIAESSGHLGIGNAPFTWIGIYSLTNATASAGAARIFQPDGTLTAAANNDILAGIYADFTAVPGAFTGVKQLAIYQPDATKANAFLGNVGIGTTSPVSDWLNSPFLQDTSAIFGGASLSSRRADGAGVRIGSLAFENLTNTATYRTQAVIESYTPASGTANKRGGEIAFLTQPDNTAGPVERIRIFSTGGVAIGSTTDPGAGSLLVTGTIYNSAAHLAISLSGTPTILSGFGTGSSIIGRDYGFQIVMGSGSPTTGTVQMGQGCTGGGGLMPTATPAYSTGAWSWSIPLSGIGSNQFTVSMGAGVAVGDRLTVHVTCY